MINVLLFVLTLSIFSMSWPSGISIHHILFLYHHHHHHHYHHHHQHHHYHHHYHRCYRCHFQLRCCHVYFEEEKYFCFRAESVPNIFCTGFYRISTIILNYVASIDGAGIFSCITLNKRSRMKINEIYK